MDSMWQPPTMELMPGFWPPKPSGFWNALLSPLRHHYLRNYYKISAVTIQGAENLKTIRPGDGALLAPNHSNDADPHVMMDVGHRSHRQLYFMAAWQVFLAHHGLDGWVMQRFGAFSVDREGCDRRAIRQATELLTNGQWLVVFPEGEIYHTNERLTPLREGVAFMTITAQRDLEKSNSGKAIWVVPTRIAYKYDQDILPRLEEAVSAMEQRFLLPTVSSEPLEKRIVRLGEVLLTIKEKQVLGKAQDGEMVARLHALIESILGRLEGKYLTKSQAEESVPLRVKTLRRAILEELGAKGEEKPKIAPEQQAALDELHMTLQLFSYPGDYVTSKPTVERMAETVEKFEEDLDGVAFPKGRRSATVTFGPPIDVRPFATGRSRAASIELTGKLEDAIRAMM
jgi:1-acyl-sn-glycerol-3-phosphate acyltransferase